MVFSGCSRCWRCYYWLSGFMFHYWSDWLWRQGGRTLSEENKLRCAVAKGRKTPCEVERKDLETLFPLLCSVCDTYWPVNDLCPQMTPIPQMIPKLDRNMIPGKAFRDCASRKKAFYASSAALFFNQIMLKLCSFFQIMLLFFQKPAWQISPKMHFLWSEACTYFPLVLFNVP